MQDFIDTITDFFWKKATDSMLTEGEIEPTLLGFYHNGGQVLGFQELVPELGQFDWGDPNERYEIYCRAFQRMKEESYPGLVSITESWVTMMNSDELKELGIDPDKIHGSAQLIKLRDKYPNIFEKVESVTIYIELYEERKLIWGRVFRNSETDTVSHISEYIELTEGHIEGLIKDARDSVFG